MKKKIDHKIIKKKHKKINTGSQNYEKAQKKKKQKYKLW
jgi:hypothetical protein